MQIEFVRLEGALQAHVSVYSVFFLKFSVERSFNLNDSAHLSENH